MKSPVPTTSGTDTRWNCGVPFELKSTSEELFRGTLTQTSVYPREVVKRALMHNAGAVILAHNHPSGLAEPSRADEVLTSSLKQALALIDVKLLDHFIVTGGADPLSFAERGLI